MILPSQPAKFSARKNENNFIQVSEAYDYTLTCSLAANFIASIGKYPTWRHSLKDSLCEFSVLMRWEWNIFNRNASHKSNGLHVITQCRPSIHSLFDIVLHLNPISHALTHAKIACPCKRGFTYTGFTGFLV